MPPHMICVLPYLNSNAQVRHLRITVPLVECLVDGVRYFRPDDLPPPAGDELRPLLRPRLTRGADQRTGTPRSPRLAAITDAAAPTLR
jgi:hypothetical protein